jgi:HlyD family secretion protein
MKNKRLMLVLVGIAVAVILLAAFASLRGKEIPVRADRVQRADIAASITTNGKIQAVNNFEAHAPAPTTVKRVLVQQGDHVNPGQLLIQLDDADARAQAAKALANLRSAEAALNAVQGGGTKEEVLTTESELVKARGDLATARRNYDAMQSLEQRGAASPAEVQVALNRLNAAQAQVSLLEQKQTSRYSHPEIAKVVAQEQEARTAYSAAEELLRELNVRAPRAGMVYALPVRAGSYVQAGELLVQVADLSTVEVVAFVDEPDIGRLVSGEKVTLTWDALPGRSWQGAVTRVPTTVITRGARSVGEIACTVPNPGLQLLPNVNVNVNITTARHDNVLTIAREAIRQDDGQRYVYEISNGALHKRDVQTSISNPTRIEITQGVRDNTLIALNSLNGQALRDGMPVRVVQP